MKLAIEQAEKGRGLTSPNPNVGSVIVKDAELLGAGWHRKAGQPHAEREAIADALTRHHSDSLKGATIYITLEPCSTQGRTPPCVDGIIEAGITRVVYGAVDPNPEHAGRADAILRQKGIDVLAGVEREACEYLHRAFIKRVTTGKPWVIVKTAMSLDGRITRPAGEGQWLTGEESRAEVQRIRCEVDAIITGANTIREDDPQLTLRGEDVPAGKQQPWRVVLTRGKKEGLPADAKVFNDNFKVRTLVYENLELTNVLTRMSKMNCDSVLVESGGSLLASFFKSGEVDEVVIFYAPMICGGVKLGVGGSEGFNLRDSVHLSNIKNKLFGDDLMLRGVVKKN